MSLEALGDRLLDRDWRLRNLYWFTDKAGQKRLFEPNWAQQEVYQKLGRRNLDLKVRQLGITTGYCMLWLDSVLFNRDLRVGIIAHTRGDAAIIFRDKIKYAYESLPDEVRAAVPAVKNDAGELVLANGSGIRVGVTFRSGTVQILHITEYGYICSRMPKRAEEIKTGAMQAVPQDGIIVIEATAKGRSGHFYDLVSEAEKRVKPGPHDYALNFLPWWKHHEYQTPPDPARPFAQTAEEKQYLDDLQVKIARAITLPQREWYCRKARELGEDVFAEYPSTAEEAFRQTTQGAYYGRQMLDAWRSGRITRVPVEPGLPVETWWDIGNDTTSIWFAQRYGLEVRLVDYYANVGEPIVHYANYVTAWRDKHGASMGRAIGPHDLRVKDWGGNGETRLQRAAALGINFEIAPELSVSDGIEAVRNTLPRCIFDEENCAAGIKGLESYRKEWNEALGVWRDQPLHDWASHPSDSFRYGALSMSKAPAQIGVASRSAARKVVQVKWK